MHAVLVSHGLKAIQECSIKGAVAHSFTIYSHDGNAPSPSLSESPEQVQRRGWSCNR